MSLKKRSNNKNNLRKYVIRKEWKGTHNEENEQVSMLGENKKHK